MWKEIAWAHRPKLFHHQRLAQRRRRVELRAQQLAGGLKLAVVGAGPPGVGPVRMQARVEATLEDKGHEHQTCGRRSRHTRASGGLQRRLMTW